MIGGHNVVEEAIHNILIDAHFYVIALRNLYRFLAKAVGDPAFEQFKPEVDRVNNVWFKHFAKAREAFEQIDQHLPGEKQEHQLEQVTDGCAPHKIHYALSLRKGIFKHSMLSFYISREAFSRLKSEVEGALLKILDNCPQMEETRTASIKEVGDKC